MLDPKIPLCHKEIASIRTPWNPERSRRLRSLSPKRDRSISCFNVSSSTLPVWAEVREALAVLLDRGLIRRRRDR